MRVTAWNNGKYYPTGAGYGLKVDANDRDMYFSRDWSNVILELVGAPNRVVINVNKSSFWGATCRELINKDIGIWLIKNGKAPWPKGCPPKMRMESMGSNRFRVDFL